MKILAGIVFFLICSPIVFIFISIFRGSKKEKNKVTIDKNITELIPISYYATDLDAYVLKDNTYINFFKINTKDIYSVSEDERTWDDMKFAKLYQTYTGELKCVILNFPTNTLVQQEYWKHKIETTANPVLKKQQEEKLFQLEWLQTNSTKREFYLFYFSENKEQLKKNTSDILAIMGTGRDGLLELISPAKKHQILFKLANKNAQIFTTNDAKKGEV